MQTTLLGFAIGMILALLAALVAPHFINWNDHRAFFEAEAGKLVGVPVRVTGHIDVGILPFPSVTLESIAIGPEREVSRLRAKSLRIELGLGPLLRGEVRAVDMKLVAPELSVGIDNSGHIDWPVLALAAETLSIDKLRIESGRVALADAGSGSQMVLDQLWFTGEVRSLTGPVRGRGEFVTGGTLYGYDISAGRYASDGMRIKLALKTDERPVTVEADGLLAFERGAPSFDGVLTLARLAGAVLASGKAVSYEPWRLSSKVQAGAASAVMDNVLFQYGPDERAAALTGTAEFKFGPKPQLQGHLSARQIDLDRLLATPDSPRRLPLAAVQAFGEMLGGALRPSWPVGLAIGVDNMTVGGAMLQSVACDLQSDGTNWTVRRLEFRAPGFTQVKVQGRLSPLGQGLGFAGGTEIESNDPMNLAAWLAGRASTQAQMKPWQASGDLTLGADRIAVERLKTDFGRGAVEGRASYAWPAGDRPARLEANLRAAELDIDAVMGFGASALSGLGLELPREVALAIEIERARVAALEARNVTARVTVDDGGIAIERLSIADFGNAVVEAKGRIDTRNSLGGNIAIDLNARDTDGVVALAEKIAPALGGPLRRLAGTQKSAALHADVSVTHGSGDSANGKLAITGRIGALRLNVAASAAGKREAFQPSNPRALADTEMTLDGRVEADDPASLLAVFGLDRLPSPERRPARLSVTAHGPPGRDRAFEAKLDASPIDAAGKGRLRIPADQPAAIDLDDIAGSIGGNKVQGRLALRFDDTLRADGSVEAEALDVAATIAAAVGMPAGRNGERWSADPLDWSLPKLEGRISFKAQRATFAETLRAQQLRGVARFGASGLVFEDVAAEMADGRFEGRVAFETRDEGLFARVRAGLAGAEAGALFAGSAGPAVSGRLTVQAEVEGTGRSPAAFMGSLAGFANFSLERGQVAGLNPGVFDAVGRAVELGIPTTGDRIGQFVIGVLDSAKVPVPSASANISIKAGLARFDDIAIPLAGAEMQAIAGINLGDGTLNALLTLTGQTGASKVKPALAILLRGPVLAPRRTVDTTLLTSWLTLLTVEQQSRQIDAMEKAAREAAAPEAVKPAVVPETPASAPTPQPQADTGAARSSESHAPPLPPAVEVPVRPRPRPPQQRSERVAPVLPDLIGAPH